MIGPTASHTHTHTHTHTFQALVCAKWYSNVKGEELKYHYIENLTQFETSLWQP